MIRHQLDDKLDCKQCGTVQMVPEDAEDETPVRFSSSAREQAVIYFRRNHHRPPSEPASVISPIIWSTLSGRSLRAPSSSRSRSQ
jgi:hypothetical protein